jgi:alpha-beta hydrolase superfamily lysophospholipase
MPTASIAPTEDRFDGVKGMRIFYRSWRPAGAKAVVIVSHGFNAHSGQYLWVGSELASKGYAVWALDHQGRGLSDGERFYVDRLTDWTDDLHSFVGLARAAHPGLPVFLLGHSAGGVIACSYCLEHQDQLAGLICESFAYRVPAPDFAIAVLKGISHLAPHAHVLKLKNEDFSRDPAVVAAMNADPLIADETQPTRTVAELARADDRLREGFPAITLPVLIVHGSLDRATKPEGSREFFERTGSKDKVLKIYEGHFHDLLNDLGREEVLADMLAWLDARVPNAAMA